VRFTDKESESSTQLGIKFADRERRRISGELHDNVSSMLSVIRHKIDHSPHSTKEVLKLLDNVMFTVRRLSHGLHPPYLEKIGFVDAVRDFVLPLHDLLDIKIYHFARPNTPLKRQCQLHLFRIFQEVLNNILKHAGATHVLIHVHHSKNYFNLSVQDNGIGFTYYPSNNSLGIKNIIYRAKKINAKFKFKQPKSGGTLFIISVPLTYNIFIH